MQSYGEFGLIPRKSANSSSTCVDNCFIFGQIGKTGPKVVQRDTKIPQILGNNIEVDPNIYKKNEQPITVAHFHL